VQQTNDRCQVERNHDREAQSRRANFIGYQRPFLHGVVGAQEPVKTCPAVEVRSLELSHIVGKAMVSWIDQPKIEATSVHIENGKQRDSGKKETVIIAHGPSMSNGRWSSPTVPLSFAPQPHLIPREVIQFQ
jgi:hypothetical protein